MQASHLVRVHKDKLTVTYNGKANHNHDVGAVQSNRAFSSNVLIGYFEMTILNQGERGCMAIGLGNSNFDNKRHPGWEPHSYGYHGDDGRYAHGFVFIFKTRAHVLFGTGGGAARSLSL